MDPKLQFDHLLSALKCNPESIRSNYSVAKFLLQVSIQLSRQSEAPDFDQNLSAELADKVTDLRKEARGCFAKADEQQRAGSGQRESGSAFFLTYLDLIETHQYNHAKIEKGLREYVKRNKGGGYFLVKLYDWRAFRHLSEADNIKKAIQVGKQTLSDFSNNTGQDGNAGLHGRRWNKLAGSIGINLFKQGAKKYKEAMVYLISSIPSGLVAAYEALTNLRAFFLAKSKPTESQSDFLPLWAKLNGHIEACQGDVVNLGLHQEIAEFQDTRFILEKLLGEYDCTCAGAAGVGDSVSVVMHGYISALQDFLNGVGGQLLWQTQKKNLNSDSLRAGLAKQYSTLAALSGGMDDAFWDRAVAGAPAKQPVLLRDMQGALTEMHRQMEHFNDVAEEYIGELEAGKNKAGKAQGRLDSSDLLSFCSLHVSACKGALRGLRAEYGDLYIPDNCLADTIEDEIDEGFKSALHPEDMGDPAATLMEMNVSSTVKLIIKTRTDRLRASDGKGIAAELKKC